MIRKTFSYFAIGALATGLALAAQQSAKTETKPASSDAKTATKAAGKPAKHATKSAVKTTKKSVHKSKAAPSKTVAKAAPSKTVAKTKDKTQQ